MRLSTHRTALTTLLVVTTACGSRTAPIVDDEDASRPRADAGRDAGSDAGHDAGPPLPPCGEPVPVGVVRFRVPDVAGAPSFGADGTLYVPVANPDRSIDLAAHDRCTGEELWRREAMPPSERPGIVRRPVVRWTSAGELVLANTGGYGLAYALFRFETGGAPLGRYEPPDRLSDFFAIPRGLGPAVRSYSREEGQRTVVLDLDGAVIGTFELAAGPGDECVAGDGALVCYDGAWRLPDGAAIWERGGGAEIIDGTLRHVVPPALARDRLYAVIFGISTYDFVALDAADGSRVFREPLMRTERGQTDLRIGRPVVGPDGTIFIYANGHRRGADHTGELSAWTPDGVQRWTFEADASREEFFTHATHVVGDAGVVYLGIGHAVRAIDAADGALRWELPVDQDVNTPQVALSEAGDLAVRTDADELLVIATESMGLARSDWPAPGGDERNAEAR